MNIETAKGLLQDYKQIAEEIIAGKDHSFQTLGAIDMCLGCNLSCSNETLWKDINQLEVTQEIYKLFPDLIKEYERRSKIR